MEAPNSNPQLLNQMIGGYWMTQAIRVAAELGIADLLAEGPRTAEELASRTGAHGASLFRVLRALASVGVFSEGAEGRFTLTPLAESLRSDGYRSQRSFAIMMGAEFYQSWGELLHTVRSGEEAFRKRFGTTFFEYMTGHPDRHSLYDAAMTWVHGAETEPMLDAYDFSRFRTVVDIGGGNGLALAGILKRYPTVRGILLELPGVAERARSAVSEMGLSDRLAIAGSDFFSAVPVADGYVMRHVIHDWRDDEAATILRNCREAMEPDGRVLLVETVIPPGNGPCFGKWLDLMMLVIGGRERTEKQYRQLLSRAGLKLNRVVPTTHEVSVIEAVRAD